MNFKPILFSTPMVQAILEGRKTMTRRIVKPQPNSRATEIVYHPKSSWKKTPWHARLPLPNETEYFEVTDLYKCPYGQAGDVLWVRESAMEFFDTCDHPELVGCPQERWTTGWAYKTDKIEYHNHWTYVNDSIIAGFRKGFKPSIHMPKSACRIFLEITDIRVERLQDITPHDAGEEGVEYWNIDREAFEGGELVADYKNYTWRDDEGYEDYIFSHFANPIDSFRTLWQSINGYDSWSANPWVWVVSFKRIDKPLNFLS